MMTPRTAPAVSVPAGLDKLPGSVAELHLAFGTKFLLIGPDPDRAQIGPVTMRIDAEGLALRDGSAITLGLSVGGGPRGNPQKWASPQAAARGYGASWIVWEDGSGTEIDT